MQRESKRLKHWRVAYLTVGVQHFLVVSVFSLFCKHLTSLGVTNEVRYQLRESLVKTCLGVFIP